MKQSLNEIQFKTSARGACVRFAQGGRGQGVTRGEVRERPSGTAARWPDCSTRRCSCSFRATSAFCARARARPV